MTQEQIDTIKRRVAEIRRLATHHHLVPHYRDAILEACDAIDLAVWGPRVRGTTS